MSSSTPDISPRDERTRRNIQLAWIHVLIAASFLVAFVWMQVHR